MTNINHIIAIAEMRLKPCPECGKAAKISKDEGRYCVSCQKCGLTNYDDRFVYDGVKDSEIIGLIGQSLNDFVDEFSPLIF